MNDPSFQPGFRISRRDIVVLVLGAAAATAVALLADPWLGLAAAGAVGHFFLFCNVFRVSRGLELAWAALYVGVIAYTLGAARPHWPAAFAIALAAAAVVIVIQVRKPSYHGVGWQRVNPGLARWWRESRRDAEAVRPGGPGT